MNEEISVESTYDVAWGCDNGSDVICFAKGTEEEADRCLSLLRELRQVLSDDRFTYRVRELTDEEYAESIRDLEDWESLPCELDDLLERIRLEIAEAADEAMRRIEDEIEADELEIKLKN